MKQLDRIVERLDVPPEPKAVEAGNFGAWANTVWRVMISRSLRSFAD